MNMENNEVITSAINGDTNALSVLLMEHRGIIAAAVSRIVYEKEYRKDVIQNVFLKAVAGIRSFKGACSFSTWLYRIAINESVDYCRKNCHVNSLLDSIENIGELLIDENESDGLDNVSKKEIFKMIGDTLNNCPLSERSAFSLFYYCGFSGKEAAEAMQISEDNFYMKLKAARDRIRAGLKKKGLLS